MPGSLYLPAMYTFIFLALFLVSLGLFLWSLKRYYALLSENIKLKAEHDAEIKSNEMLQNKFQALATNALDDNAKRFLELAKTTLEKESMQAGHSFQNLVKPIENVYR
jgi:hypothetical protein